MGIARAWRVETAHLPGHPDPGVSLFAGPPRQFRNCASRGDMRPPRGVRDLRLGFSPAIELRTFCRHPQPHLCPVRSLTRLSALSRRAEREGSGQPCPPGQRPVLCGWVVNRAQASKDQLGGRGGRREAVGGLGLVPQTQAAGYLQGPLVMCCKKQNFKELEPDEGQNFLEGVRWH